MKHIPQVTLPKSVTVDFRKEEYKDIFSLVIIEAERHNGKIAPAIIDMLEELMVYRGNDKSLYIKNSQNIIVSKV